VPQQPRTWFAQGTLRALSCERYWAQRTAREPVPPPSNLIVQGGSGTTEELVASTERGLLITSLWYIRSLDPRTLLYTGLTRDGVFWIENGRIAYPVRNFRWNDSPISVLKNVLAMSAPVSVPPRPQSTVGMLVPALKLRRFGLSSISDAI
jgi:predicted Zn-dependent protease